MVLVEVVTNAVIGFALSLTDIKSIAAKSAVKIIILVNFFTASTSSACGSSSIQFPTKSKK